METKLQQAITDILNRASSGTAVSVLSTSTKGEGSIFQAYYIPVVYERGEERKWFGYLQGLWSDRYGKLREDTVNDRRLLIYEDLIIHYETDHSSGNTVVSRWKDTDGDRQEDLEVDKKALSELSVLLEAGKKLALMDPDNRTIYTFMDKNGDGIPQTGEFGSNIFLPENSEIWPYLGVSDNETAQKVIRFVRGEDIEGFREREVTVDSQLRVWKLGDIVHSTPVVVGRPMGSYHLIYSDESFRKYYRAKFGRRNVIYVGSNDGMLHAFNAGFYHEGDDPNTTDKMEEGYWTTEDYDFGQELWAYIPYNLLPHLRWLSDPEYCHVYYVDLKPEVVDARVFEEDDTHTEGWGTILIGGLRFGGGPIEVEGDFDNDGENETRTFRSSYFAIDVTDPLNPQLLWEFTDSDLGYTTSQPAIMRFGDPQGKGKWYVVFGSGPTTLDGDTNQRGYIYVLDLGTGDLVLKKDVTEIDESFGEAVFMASPITVDLGLDYQVDRIYIGLSYKKPSGSWAGAIIRVDTKESHDPTQWEFSVFMKFDQPMTSAPSVALDRYNRLWLYWGTGRYYSEADKADTSSQKFYGVWDPGEEIDVSKLEDVTDIRVFEQGWVDIDGDDVADNTFLGYLAERRIEYAEEQSYGWYLELDSGERVLDKPVIIGGIVLFTAFKPNDDICGFGGESHLYALYYETGTAYKESVIGYGEDTIVVNDQPLREILKKKEIGEGVPTSVVLHSGQEEGVVSLIQLGTGRVVEVQTTPAFSPKSRIILWREVT